MDELVDAPDPPVDERDRTDGTTEPPARITHIEFLRRRLLDVDALRSQARPDSLLIEDLGLDSLDLLEFYLRLGDKFDITVSEDDYPTLTSVDAIVAFLQERVTR